MVYSGSVVSALERMDAAPDPGGVWLAWRDMCREQGFPRAAIGRVARGARPVRQVTVHEMTENWDSGAADQYAARDYVQVDPMINAALDSPQPILQHIDAFAELAMPALLRELFEMPFNQAFPCKLCVPVHRGDGTALVFTAMGALRPDEAASLPAEATLQLRMAAYAGASRLAQFEAPATAGEYVLSPRERECLSWLAKGYRNVRIADRMGISVATVEMHIASARRKLDASTREQALARAIILREITP